MMTAFRKFFSSRIGIAVTLGFLALIALAFASSDVANTGSFGGVAGGDRIAVVGDRKIGTGDTEALVRNQVEALRRENPTLTMEAFIAQGGLEGLLEQQFDRVAMAEYAEKYGFRAGNRLVDSEIASIGAFNGPDGNFSETVFRQALAQQGISEAAVRQDLANSLLLRQVAFPIGYAAVMPRSIAARYAGLFREERSGAILTIPSLALAPEGDPTDAQLRSYYTANRSDFIRPERRVIRYATFGEDALSALPAPTDKQIAARYRRDQAEYAASEARTFTQLVVPTRAAAQAVISEVRGGTSLTAAARGKGLATTTVGPVERGDFARQSSPAVAQAAFEAAEGGIAAPARGPLGYYVIRVDEIDRQGGRSLAQVRAEIAEQLAAEQRRAALNDLASRIEEQFDDGANLAEVARGLNVDLEETRPVTADGRIYGTQDETAPQELAPVFAIAFDMDEGAPQIAEVEPGVTFMVFDVTDITASAPAPLAEIRDDVTLRWRLAQGSQEAQKAADRIVKRVRDGATMAEAVSAENVRGAQLDPVNLSREQLNAQTRQGGRVPPPLALLFSMAEGTVKRLEGAQDAVWFVVALDEIDPGEVDATLVENFQQALSGTLGDEYRDQFRLAAREEVGVERNEDAIAALRERLAGGAN